MSSLEVESWSEEQKIIQAWFAMPPADRTPKTQRALAELVGVHEQTISRWKQLPGFADAVTHLARRLLAEDLPAIYGALRDQAKQGSFQHIKLALELAGEMRSQGDDEQNTLARTSFEDELRRVVERIYGIEELNS